MSTPDTAPPPVPAVPPPSLPAPPSVAPAPPVPPPSGADGRTAERLLTELRGEIARADSKASVLVAALGMTAGAFTALLAGRGWTPAELSWAGTGLWWAGAAALGLSLFALLLAVLPRYSQDTWTPGRPLCYFGDIQQALREGRLAAALADTARDPAAGLMAALIETSRIAARKHQWIRIGLIAFCAGTTLLPAALLTG